MGRLYGRDEWKPSRILMQIFIMQAQFYVAFTFSLWLVALVSGTPFLASEGFFAARGFDVSTARGLAVAAATCFASAVGAFALVKVVERAKKCLDFTFTVFFLHFLLVCVAEGFPDSWGWWLLQVVCLIAMNALGEYLCMRRELAEITLDDIRRDRGDAVVDLGMEMPASQTRTLSL